MNGDAFVAADDESVLIKTGDVTTISGGPSPSDAGDGIATGGEAIAASLSPEQDVLNVAFFTGAGGVQIIQLRVADLSRARQTAAGADDEMAVMDAELIALSADVISNGRGAATPVGSVAVAAGLGDQGDLNLSFVDGDGDLQLIQTNVVELVPGPDTGTAGSAASGSESTS